MANRYPLIVDTSSGNQIKELPSGDNLNLTGNGLVGVTSLSVINSISSATVQTSGNATIGGSVTVTGSISTNTNLNVTGVVRINGTNILELVDWDDLNNVPAFANVATTGNYNDLNNKPVLATVATTGNYNDLNNKPVLSSSDIINALGYTPYDDFNPEGYISELSLTGLTDTPNTYSGQAGKFLQINGSENGIQFSTTSFTLTSGDVIDALGYTPYNGLTNPNNYLTAEADTLDAITDRSNATTNSITVGGLTANGQVSGTSLRSTGNLLFDTNGTITVDSNAGILIIGGTSTLQIKSQSAISFYNSIIPDTTNVYDLGSDSRYFSNSYVQNTVYYGDLQGIPGKSNVTIGAAGSINITPGTATSRVSIFAGVFRLPVLTTTQRNALTPQFGDVIYNNTTSQVQVYVAIASYSNFEPVAGWVNLYNPPAS